MGVGGRESMEERGGVVDACEEGGVGVVEGNPLQRERGSRVHLRNRWCRCGKVECR